MKKILEIVVEPQDILNEELEHIKGGYNAPIDSDCTDGCNNGKITTGKLELSAW